MKFFDLMDEINRLVHLFSLLILLVCVEAVILCLDGREEVVLSLVAVAVSALVLKAK
tara:strand:- start:1154 stop:1324 length:171 start_codon:yes stop_codon:yes gene_type:complete